MGKEEEDEKKEEEEADFESVSSLKRGLNRLFCGLIWSTLLHRVMEEIGCDFRLNV